MKSKTKEVLFVLVLGLVIPGLLFRIAAGRTEKLPEQTDAAEQTQPPTSPPTQPTDPPEQMFSLPVLMADGTVTNMELDNYVLCVVLAEMPAEFEAEALKAQAVAARTYALKRYQAGNKHERGAVCTNSACCQAYCAQADFLARGESEASLEKVRQAVAETHDLVLTYNGALIEATYFSCSGGRTEDAIAVWGAQIPYLQAVDSPGEENAAHFMDTVSFSLAEFAACMELDKAVLTGQWVGAVTYTAGGGVDTIQIGGQTYQGTTVRQKLGLRSTVFVMTAVGDTVTVTTKGFGHRVGMSQYGAEAMAVAGSSYRQILAYYYQGTALETRA